MKITEEMVEKMATDHCDEMRGDDRSDVSDNVCYELNKQAFRAAIALLLPIIEKQAEALNDLAVANERMFIQLGRVRRDLVYIHNNDDPEVAMGSIRMNVLVVACKIGLELEGKNFWNISPAIDKSRQTQREVEATLKKITGGEG